MGVIYRLLSWAFYLFSSLFTIGLLSIFIEGEDSRVGTYITGFIFILLGMLIGKYFSSKAKTARAEKLLSEATSLLSSHGVNTKSNPLHQKSTRANNKSRELKKYHVTYRINRRKTKNFLLSKLQSTKTVYARTKSDARKKVMDGYIRKGDITVSKVVEA